MLVTNNGNKWINKDLIKSSLGKNVNCVNKHFGCFLLDWLAKCLWPFERAINIFFHPFVNTEATIYALICIQVLQYCYKVMLHTVVKACCIVSELKCTSSKNKKIQTSPNTETLIGQTVIHWKSIIAQRILDKKCSWSADDQYEVCATLYIVINPTTNNFIKRSKHFVFC